jgi:hypothetical protein
MLTTSLCVKWRYFNNYCNLLKYQRWIFL